MLLSIGSIFLLFAVCFSIYQYQREKEYKIDILHSRLQVYNYEMAQTLGDSVTSVGALRDYVMHHNLEGLRVTVVSRNGRVLADSYETNVDSLGNHSDRTEIRQALRGGNGYDIKRTSESTHETYFYSATRVGDYVIRSAVPYSAELTRSLQADNTYIYYAIALTMLLGVALYWATRRISRHIGYLREFAMKAEEGEELDHELERRLPDDELGDISHTIIQLYWKQRHAEEDKQRIKRQLTQNAAHELKTPAASIHGYLESILDNPEMDTEKRQHFLERCYAQSERMNKLLQDMSALTKLEEKPLPSPPLKGRGALTAEIDVKAIVDNVLADTSLDLQNKGIAVSADIPSSVVILSPLGETEGASAIYSIFRNLVDNTIAYATGATWLKLECKKVDDCRYEFIVSDNGQGVEPQHLEHLFERFYRVDKGRSRKLGGTGLGLAIVKNAAHAHGGTTTAELTPGGGLTIRFTLGTVRI